MLTPKRRAELRGLAESSRPVIRYGGTDPAAIYVLAAELTALLDAADERDRLSAAVESLAEWHETKAMKARHYRSGMDGQNVVMDKAAEVHDDAARRIHRALDGSEDE